MFPPSVDEARRAALGVLLHNAHGPFGGLPRTAGWGYPEPYTRDMMISALGVLVSGSDELVASLGSVLAALARHQHPLGLIPSLANEPLDRGASDTTPLFLIGLALFRQVTGRPDFLEDATRRALTWMQYQSPDATPLVAQQPTSDWRDEQWVLGYGLYVNALVHTYQVLFGMDEEAAGLRKQMNRFDIRKEWNQRHIHEGLAVPDKPYYALWSYKVLNDERFDLLGNSLAILSGMADTARARAMVAWVEAECEAARAKGDLAPDLPPCLLPYIRPSDPDWHERYAQFNMPGEYHNGGVWPFISGFYIAALVAVGEQALAEQKLAALAKLVRPARQAGVAFGFNEWFRAQDGTPRGEDWQSWSAALYLYAVACVERRETPFFENVRRRVSAWQRQSEASYGGASREANG